MGMKQINKLYLAILIVAITSWYPETLKMKIIITAIVLVAFIFLVINDFLKDRKRKKTKQIIIEEILNSLRRVWHEYKETTKDIHQKRVVMSTNTLHTIPAEFRPMLPNWHWQMTELKPISDVFSEKETSQINQFCNDIDNIVFLYNQIRDLGGGSYDSTKLPELTKKWETLVTKVLEQGNPLNGVDKER
jgi:hypothetical protein